MFLTYLYLTTNYLLVNARTLAASSCISCTTDCVKCIGRITNPGEIQSLVTLNLSSCKNGDSMSWLCCREGCDRIQECDGSISGLKCDEVTQVSYWVSAEEEKLLVQVHDGKLAGDVDCSVEGACCGGSGTSCVATSGVCNFEIDLNTCGNESDEDEYGEEQSVDLNGCTSDVDCLSSSCGDGKCNYGQCIIVPKLNGVICREAMGNCDVVDVCNGVDALCPEDAKYGSETVCRESVDICDSIEVCDGLNDDCPLDVKHGSETVCRETVYGIDGKTCDQEERCDGSNDGCPEDGYLSEGITCRNAADLCDVTDVCSGTSAECPSDLRNDRAITYKCATTCYLCGVNPSEMSVNSGGSSILGQFTIGKCDKYVALEWPACETNRITGICPNNRALSNFADYVCNPSDGKWIGVQKTNV